MITTGTKSQQHQRDKPINNLLILEFIAMVVSEPGKLPSPELCV